MFELSFWNRLFRVCFFRICKLNKNLPKEWPSDVEYQSKCNCALYKVLNSGHAPGLIFHLFPYFFVTLTGSAEAFMISFIRKYIQQTKPDQPSVTQAFKRIKYCLFWNYSCFSSTILLLFWRRTKIYWWNHFLRHRRTSYITRYTWKWVSVSLIKISQ